MFTQSNRNPKKAAMVNQFNDRLEMLEETTQMFSALKTHFSDVKQWNVLSIGCGDEPYEIDALQKFSATHNMLFNYVGIDVNSADISHCQSEYRNQPNVNFHIVDGMDYPSIQKLFDKEVHLIILRHPLLFRLWSETVRVADFFERILNTTVPFVLAEGGGLIVTLYHPEERDSFIKLASMMTDDKPIELDESKKTFYQTEYVTTPLGDVPRDVYSDRYFFALPHFHPNQVLLAEKKNGLFEQENEHVKTIVKMLSEIHHGLYDTQDKYEQLAALLDQVIHNAISCKANYSGNALLAKLSENICQTLASDKVELKKNDKLSTVSFNMLKHKPNSNEFVMKKYYCAVANAILQTVAAGGDQEACYKALQLVGTRPIIDTTQMNSKKEEPPVVQYSGMGF